MRYLKRKLDFPTPASPVRITKSSFVNISWARYFYKNGQNAQCH